MAGKLAGNNLAKNAFAHHGWDKLGNNIELIFAHDPRKPDTVITEREARMTKPRAV